MKSSYICHESYSIITGFVDVNLPYLWYIMMLFSKAPFENTIQRNEEGSFKHIFSAFFLEAPKALDQYGKSMVILCKLQHEKL